ncbi:MAG: hypothetical protein WA399_07810 [Acidobacteriaceae bacterium]
MRIACVSSILAEAKFHNEAATLAARELNGKYEIHRRHGRTQKGETGGPEESHPQSEADDAARLQQEEGAEAGARRKQAVVPAQNRGRGEFPFAAPH